MTGELTIAQAMDLAVKKHNEGNLSEAELIYQKILEKSPNNSDALHLLGLVAHQLGRHEEATVKIEEAIRLNPNVAVYYGNLGMVYDSLEREEESTLSFKKALSLDPNYGSAKLAHYNLVVYYRDRGEFDESLEHYNKAIELDNGFYDAYWNRGLLLLILRRFEEGLEDYEYRFKKKTPTDPRVFGKPKWQGDNLNGKKILVASEQGFGDSIQFIRFLPKIKEKGGYVILECRKELRRLYRRLEGVDELVEKEKNAIPHGVFDFYIHLLSLPLVFKTILEDIPKKIPYITPEWDLLPEVASKLKTEKFKVGLNWAGNPNFPYDKDRSMSFGKLKPLLEISGIEFFSL